MGTQRLQEILGENPAFESLKARLGLLAPIQQALLQAVPHLLRSHVQVTALEGECLHLQVSSQAVAARLRQQSPTLVRHLKAVAPDIAELLFHVAPQTTTTRPTRVGSPIPPEALEAFESLAASLSPSPLKTALLRLLQARGRQV